MVKCTAEGASEPMTGEELDALEPRDLEYRCCAVLRPVPQASQMHEELSASALARAPLLDAQWHS